jgi:hypothetical protein
LAARMDRSGPRGEKRGSGSGEWATGSEMALIACGVGRSGRLAGCPGDGGLAARRRRWRGAQLGALAWASGDAHRRRCRSGDHGARVPQLKRELESDRTLAQIATASSGKSEAALIGALVSGRKKRPVGDSRGGAGAAG